MRQRDMYGLSTPLSQTLTDPEFDSISSILTHSGLQPNLPWKSSVDCEGNLFYVELDRANYVEIKDLHSYGTTRGHLLSSSLPRQYKTASTHLKPDKKVTSKPENGKYVFNKNGLSTENCDDNKMSSDFMSKIDDIYLHQNGRKTDISIIAPPKKNKHHNGITLDNGQLSSPRSKSNYHTWSPRKRNKDVNVMEVYISINSNLARNGHKKPSTLCERLLGIVPGVLAAECSGDIRSKETPDDSLVTVCALVPDSSALRCRKIKIGQVLLTVNECKVTSRSLEPVLTELLDTRHSNKVKLTLRNNVIHEASVPVLRRRNHNSGQTLAQNVRGDNHTYLPPGGSVMYLTLDEETSEDKTGKEDILYEFPRCSSSLETIRGVFLTLPHTLRDLSNSHCKFSSLLINSVPTQVCYYVNGRNVLVMSTTSDRQTAATLEILLDDVVQLVQYIFNTVDSAFTNPSHHPTLDHIFHIIYQCYLTTDKPARVTSPFCTLFSSCQVLSLPPFYKSKIDSELSNLEAADFADKSEDKFGLRRSYTILGSCLFYKGYLLCNHLPEADSTDINLYLTYNGLLPTCHSLKQLVIWQEVFPSRRCQDVPHKHVFGYSEPQGRWFLLVIGVEDSMLCVVLEAAGCSNRLVRPPGPDCYYIDQTKACLLQIMTSHLMRIADIRIHNDDMPILSADWFYNGKQNNLTSQSSWHGRSLTQINNHTDSSLRYRANSLDKTVSSSSGKLRTFKRSISLGSEKTSAAGLPTTKAGNSHSLDVIDVASVTKNSASVDATLFNYVYIDKTEGVLICPASNPHGHVHTELTENFYEACLTIRKLFKLSTHVQKVLDDNEEPTFGLDVTFDMVEEHGILFQFNQSQAKKSLPLTYWVVGRRFNRGVPLELYVCFHESTPPNLIELAFQLGYGRTVT